MKRKDSRSAVRQPLISDSECVVLGRCVALSAVAGAQDANEQLKKAEDEEMFALIVSNAGLMLPEQFSLRSCRSLSLAVWRWFLRSWLGEFELATAAVCAIE